MAWWCNTPPLRRLTQHQAWTLGWKRKSWKVTEQIGHKEETQEELQVFWLGGLTETKFSR